jgi:hypothetical protein
MSNTPSNGLEVPSEPNNNVGETLISTDISYVMASIELIVALAGIAYSIYALIALKKTAFSYILILISVFIVIDGVIRFFYTNYRNTGR